MKFVNPAFLYALSAIAIPVVIHLFNFRRFKKVYFTNVRFLKEVQQETQSKSRLKHLLVLLARVLAVVFLVLAFAQPYIPAENTKVVMGQKAVSIYIDNSFSMDAIGRNGSLLEEAKKRAAEIVSAHKATDRFQLLTNDFEARHQRLYSREDVLAMIDEVNISSPVKTLPEILSRQFDLLSSSDAIQKKAFLVSDFQETIADFKGIRNDTSVLVQPVLLNAQNKGNVYIDSCWFSSPVRQLNKTENLHVRIRNLSEKDIENNSIKLFINGKQRTPASFSVKAGSVTEAVLAFASRESGIQNALVEIQDYPVTFDDKLYFSFTVSGSIPVLCINRDEKDPRLASSPLYLQSLFSSDSLFLYSASHENALDYSQIPSQKLIVLNEIKTISSGLAQELKRFVLNGGSVFVFPHPEADLVSYSEFLQSLGVGFYNRLDTSGTRVDKINYEHELFREAFDRQTGNIDLPLVSGSYILAGTSRSGEDVLLRMQNGNSFLSSFDTGKGRVYLSAVPLSPAFSNFARHALFVPVMYNAAIFSQPRQQIFYVLGENTSIEIPSSGITGEKLFHLRKWKGDADIIPEYRMVDGRMNVLVHDQVKEAGNYVFTGEQHDIAGISFNFNRRESVLKTLDAKELVKRYETAGLGNFSLLETGQASLKDSLAELDQGKKLYKSCLLLLLFFLAAEVALLRFWKTT